MKSRWGGTLFDSLTPAPPGTCAHGRIASERCPFCSPLPSTAQTRHEAEESIAPSAASLREKAFDTIKAHPQGITDEAGATFSGMNPNTWRPRRLELERAGRIVAAGTGKRRSGRKAVTWVASS